MELVWWHSNCQPDAPHSSSEGTAKKGKLKIGWVNLRVRLREATTRCLRCHENGHPARDCRRAVERSKQCYRCHKEGHKAEDCQIKKAESVQEGAPENNDG